MKKKYALPVSFLTIMVAMWAGCEPGAPVRKSFELNLTVTNMLDNKWECFYYSTCPPNPTMGAPCYQYNSADTSAYGSGTVFLQFGPGDTLHRSVSGNFNFAPFSYLYPGITDSLAFQPLNDSALLVLNNGLPTDTIKITTITNSLLALKYVSTQFGTTVEVDSLRR